MPTIKLSFSRGKRSKSIKDVIEEFFNQNLDGWQSHYPGLTLKRLQQEFQAYTGCFGPQYDDSHYLETPGPYWENFKSSLLNGVPLQYISRQAYFYKSEFFVDERVLIPRSETEILVEAAVEYTNSLEQDVVDIYEVGVGSGCIGLSLLQEVHNKKVNYTGTDISKEALEVFAINHFRHQFKIDESHQIKTKLTDRLEGLTALADVILSNPPYIKEEKDRDLVHNQVKKYEPSVALFLEDKVYNEWFDSFFTQVNQLLKKDGLFIMEGHENHLSELKERAENIFNVPCNVIEDYTNRKRFLKIIK